MDAGAVNVTYRQYRPGDEAAINDGFNRTFGLSRSLEEWRWKFPEHPEGRWIMLAVDGDGAIVSHYGAVPVRLMYPNGVVRAGQVVDVYTAPGVRQGLASARVHLATVKTFIDETCRPDGLAACYGFPSTRPLKLGVIGSGYAQATPQEVPVWRRDAARPGRRFTGHRVTSGFDAAAVDAIWNAAHRRYTLAAVRDGAWLGRRFCGRPGVEYLHLIARRRGRPVALAVLRPMGRLLAWAELVWDGIDTRALAALDSAASAIARAGSCDRIEMWMGGDNTVAAGLSYLGWAGEPHGEVRLVFHSFHPEIDPERVPGNVYITMSDADLV